MWYTAVSPLLTPTLRHIESYKPKCTACSLPFAAFQTSFVFLSFSTIRFVLSSDGSPPLLPSSSRSRFSHLPTLRNLGKLFAYLYTTHLFPPTSVYLLSICRKITNCIISRKLPSAPSCFRNSIPRPNLSHGCQRPEAPHGRIHTTYRRQVIDDICTRSTSERTDRESLKVRRDCRRSHLHRRRPGIRQHTSRVAFLFIWLTISFYPPG